jgi:hypothetical protein
MRRTVSLIALLLTACDIVDPPPYPDISGTYDLVVTFDNVQANGAGQLVIGQETRQESRLSGGAVFSLSYTLGGRSYEQQFNQHFTDATVDENGAVRFWVGSGEPNWLFIGTAADGQISGTHVWYGLNQGGTWVATRRGPIP